MDAFYESSRALYGDAVINIYKAMRHGNLKKIEDLLKNSEIQEFMECGGLGYLLCDAACYDQVKVARLLINKYHWPVDRSHSMGRTLLHHACSKGHISFVRMLMSEYSANANALDKNSNTPLHLAAWHGEIEVLHCLITDFSCDPNIKGANGATLLHSACFKGHAKLAVALLQNYNLDPLSTDDDGNTLLHYAVVGGIDEVVNLLITDYGCVVGCINNSKQTPLHLACTTDNLSVVRMLVTEHKADLNALDQDNDTPLHKAARSGKTEVVARLIKDFSCDPNIKGFEGRNVLSIFCSQDPVPTSLIDSLLSKNDVDPMSADDSGNTPLHHATLSGREDIVDLLITKYDCPVDCRNNYKQTPLHFACKGGYLSVVKRLIIEHKADKSIFDEKDTTPLDTAAQNNNYKVVLSLIGEFNCKPQIEGGKIFNYICRRGNTDLAEILLTCAHCNIDQIFANEDGYSPVHYAALHGNQKLVKLLITKFNYPADCKSKKKQTPLHLACSRGHKNVVKLLVTEHKADLSVSDMNNATPLDLAAKHYRFGLVEYIMSKFEFHSNNEGWIILDYLCGRGHTELVDKLLMHCNFDSLPASENGFSPLHYAALYGNVEIVNLLITKFNNHLMYNRDSHNDTPLHIAALCGEIQVVNCLIKKVGYNPKIKGAQGRTILHHACCEGHIELAVTLLQNYNLDSLSADDDGNTPLHCAASGGFEDIVDLLITKYDSSVDSTNNSGQTPLHLACSNGHLCAVKTLGKYKSDLNARDIDDHTPLHTAALYGQLDIIECMITEFNCDANVKGANGESILHCASYKGHSELIDMLVEEYKFDPLSADNDGNTPLHYAAMGDQEVADWFITEHKCPVDCVNNKKETPLHLACKMGHLNASNVLIDLKADMGAYDEDNHTPVYNYVQHLANESSSELDGKMLNLICLLGHTDLVETLLEKCNLDPIFADDDGNFCLHHAALGGREDIINLLIMKYGCLVNCKNNSKQTPLHLACYKGHLEVVIQLITEHKAELNSLDDSNAAPIDVAAQNKKFDIVMCLMTKFRCRPKTEGYAILIHLCCNGHTELVETLLTESNLDPLVTDENGLLPLHHATACGNEETVDMLISKFNCHVDSRGKNKLTPLHFACVTNHLSIVKLLVTKHKADLNACNDDNNTPLHLAASQGHTEVVDCLLSEFSCDPNIKGSYGATSLHFASAFGHTMLVDLLLTKYNLDPSSPSGDGITPLHAAAKEGRIDVVRLLITKYRCLVDYRDNYNHTPLHMACEKGHINVVRVLVKDFKADLNARDNDRNMPLHIAAWCGQKEVVNCLINDFGCDPNSKGATERTLLHLASFQGYTEIIESLLTQKQNIVDSKPRGSDGNTPLHDAALCGHKEIVNLFISKYKYSVLCRNSRKETPLHLACIDGHVGIVRMLVAEHKADLNAVNLDNNTPLHVAALSGQAEVIRCLIREFNCNTTIVGSNGRLIIHQACARGHILLVRLLIDSFHLSPISTDIHGNTPLHISAMHGQTKCMQVLLHDYKVPVNLINKSGKSALNVADRRHIVDIREIFNNHLKFVGNICESQVDYKEAQTLSYRKYSGLQRLTRIFVLGNMKSGKSTLIESLKREGYFSSWNEVSEATVPPHTSGIIPSTFFSQKIGRILFYDFAGDPEYYSSHSAIMSKLMQSLDGTNVCLILINLCKHRENILEELGYWLNFISYHGMNLNCKVLVIGSHADLINDIEAGDKVQFVSKFMQQYSSHNSKITIKILEDCLTINCRKPRSSKCVRNLLIQELLNSRHYYLRGETALLLGILERDFKNVATCTIQTLLTHITEARVYLPTTIESLYSLLVELDSLGLLMIIEGKSGILENNLLVLDVPKLTKEVHELLFSDASSQRFLTSTNPHSASMGILPKAYLKSILPEYISTDCLVQLQYCQELTHSEVKLDHSVVHTNDCSAPTLLYFPALCKIERRTSITPLSYSISCFIKCIGEFDYFPPRFLHVLLLRLAYNFAKPAVHKMEFTGVYNYRCTMWKNGIHWKMEEGVECFVENVNNCKGVVIITTSAEMFKFVCTEMLFKIVQEVNQATEEFCRTVTTEQYLMDSVDPVSYSDEDKLFLLRDVARVLTEGKPSVISASHSGNEQLDAARISHLKGYIHWDKERDEVILKCAQKQVEDLQEGMSTKLTEHNHSILFEKLSKQSSKWRDIGTHLGFFQYELDKIQARPLLSNPPNDWLNAMLQEWLQWAPRDSRGSANFATLKDLIAALDKADLTETALLVINSASEILSFHQNLT